MSVSRPDSAARRRRRVRPEDEKRRIVAETYERGASVSAVARLHTVLRDQPATLIATVHDEAVLLVPNDMQVAGTIADIARREMVAAFLDVFPNAPTLNLVDPKIGRNWGETQSLTKWLDG